MKTIIGPSILAADLNKIDEQLQECKKANIIWLHFDVMDGKFVPNTSFGADLLHTLSIKHTFFYDVHLMVEDPLETYKAYVDAGASLITFHYEARKGKKDIGRIIREIKQSNVKVGLSIKPETSFKEIKDLLKYIDLLLVMSVEPGQGGQEFMPIVLEKIEKARKIIDRKLYDCLIEVDGGINEETAKLVRDAGAHVLVSGSYIFKNNIVQAIEKLQG